MTGKMLNEYKKLVLLKGIEPITHYHFRMVKSLLASELKLTKKMQDERNKIQFADLMEEMLQSDAGVRKLIELFKAIAELENLADDLRKEMLKGFSHTMQFFHLENL
ncbi:pyrin and HIN domain-containing protein 1-like [Heterocephalus glaber]|uniref:Pyrin and HIN domain-containing protein 1-like n=1 Tax=Heterocephalus glaber TaxID=10181 RepID=A0AAX6RED5_HETGA|nr:pyrin and HIN domain-containing protein 1-like [Heterocephalus glaber]